MKLTVKLASVTFAVKARDILKSQGIRSVVRKNPRPGKGEGCGYVVVVPNAPENTVDILSFHGIDVIEASWSK